MSSLFRDLNSAAIDAKLNKNEFLIFNALLSQTLGFGKCSDPLTDKRLAELTGIRLDRLRPTLKSFLKRDLFYRVEHHRYQYEYCIADHFFDDVINKKVYTPHYAKSGETDKKPSDLTTNGGEQPTKRGHTVTNQTEIQKKPPPQTENTFTKKPPPQTENTFTKKTPPPQKTQTDLTKKQPPQNEQDAVIEIFMAGLDQMPEQFVVKSSQAVRIEFSTQDIGKVAVEQQTTTTAEAVTTTTETATVKEEINTTPIETVPDTPAIVEAEIEVSTAEPTTTETTEKPVVVVDKDEGEKKPLKLPKVVGEVNVNACNRHFQLLSYKQQQRVLLVFYAMLKTGTIRNKANYFIGLCKLAKTDDLTIPVEVEAQKTCSKKQVAVLKEDKKRRGLWSDYVCIQRFAQLENVSEAVIAERMGMEEAYAMYGQQVLQAA